MHDSAIKLFLINDMFHPVCFFYPLSALFISASFAEHGMTILPAENPRLIICNALKRLYYRQKIKI
ncbi:hypothetical protein AYY16_09190 [Morganella psychrotolerans]|nr:hypothetical protein AYY16_09190 [Morganella psychrotolerans]